MKRRTPIVLFYFSLAGFVVSFLLIIMHLPFGHILNQLCFLASFITLVLMLIEILRSKKAPPMIKIAWSAGCIAVMALLLMETILRLIVPFPVVAAFLVFGSLYLSRGRASMFYRKSDFVEFDSIDVS